LVRPSRKLIFPDESVRAPTEFYPFKKPQAVRSLLDPFEERAFARLRKIATMNMTQPTYLTLAIATHRNNDDPVEPAIVVGFGILEVLKRGPNDWSFASNAAVANTTDDEAALITQLADTLPMPRFLVAEAVDTRILAPLDAAAERANLTVAAHVRHRVARIQTALPVDVSLGMARPPAPLPYAKTPTLSPPVKVLVINGKIVDPARARADLEARAVNDWVRFLTGPGPWQTGTASIATITWMATRGSRI
jgi:hypothetical protein